MYKMKSVMCTMTGIALMTVLLATNSAGLTIPEPSDLIDGEENNWNRVWGRKCFLDDMCARISHCDRSKGLSAAIGLDIRLEGECRPKPLVWVLATGILISIIGACCCFCCCVLGVARHPIPYRRYF